MICRTWILFIEDAQSKGKCTSLCTMTYNKIVQYNHILGSITSFWFVIGERVDSFDTLY